MAALEQQLRQAFLIRASRPPAPLAVLVANEREDLVLFASLNV
jgi:hypothetical protein